MQGTSKDMASYMARVKVLAAKEGVKCYGATSQYIKSAHTAGYSAESCVQLLVKREADLSSRYAKLPRSQAAE